MIEEKCEEYHSMNNCSIYVTWGKWTRDRRMTWIKEGGDHLTTHLCLVLTAYFVAILQSCVMVKEVMMCLKLEHQSFKYTIRDECKKRNDDWGDTVLGRLEYAQDLPAVEARYHQSCSSNFHQGFSIPQLFQSNHLNDTRKSTPTNEKPEYSFLQVIQFLDDHKDNQITVSDLVAKMEEMCGDKAYSCAYMKKKIITPGVDMTRTIPRTNDYIQDLTSIGKINISFYYKNKRVMTDFRFQCLADLSPYKITQRM